MNKLLKQFAVEAGAPTGMLNKLWFDIFCQKFADRIIAELEKDAEPVGSGKRFNYESASLHCDYFTTKSGTMAGAIPAGPAEF